MHIAIKVVAQVGQACRSGIRDMSTKTIEGWPGSAALLASGRAMAGHVGLSAGIGVPVAPVYAETAPVYVAQQPAVVA